MKIKIPGHKPVRIYSDTGQSISVPGDGPVEVSEVAAGGPTSPFVASPGGAYFVASPGGAYFVATPS